MRRKITITIFLIFIIAVLGLGYLNKSKLIKLVVGDKTQKLYDIVDDNKYGLIDKDGKIVVAPKYNYMSEYVDGKCIVMTMNNDIYKYGVLDYKGDQIIPLEYDEIQNFKNGLAVARKGDTNMVINEKNEIIYSDEDKKYYSIDVVSTTSGKNVIKVGKYNENNQYKMGIVDFKGKIIVEPKYNHISDFKNGLAVVSISEKNAGSEEYIAEYGYINEEGKEIIKPKYKFAKEFEDGLAPVLQGDYPEDLKYGFIDKNGNEVIKAKYDYVQGFSEGLALVVNKKDESDYPNKEYFFIDKKGEVKIDCSNYNMEYYLEEYSEYSKFKNGFAWFGINDGETIKYGYINKYGEIVIKPQYLKPSNFNEQGYAIVGKDVKSHIYMEYLVVLIDKQGNNITNETYSDDFRNFAFDENGIAKISKRRDNTIFLAYINKQGEYIWKQRAFDKPEEINVNTAEEFINSIGSSKTMYIKDDIDLGTVIKTYKNKNRFVEASNEIGIVIKELSELKIIGQKDDGTRAKITTPYGGLAKVLSFRNSYGILVENIEIGHNTETICEGAVIGVENGGNIKIKNTDMYGCGTYGIIAKYSSGIEIVDSIIRDCKYGLVMLDYSEINIENTIMKDSKQFDMIQLSGYSNLNIVRSEIINNFGESLFNISKNSNLKINNTVIKDNYLQTKFALNSKHEFEIEDNNNQYEGNLFE